MPYAPGIEYRGDQYAAEGNQNAWQMVAGIVGSTLADAKKARSLRTTLAAYAPAGDEGKAYTAKVQTMGLPELEGELQKQTITKTMQQFQQEQQQRAASIAADNMRTRLEGAQLSKLQGDETADSNFQQNYTAQSDAGNRVAAIMQGAAPAIRAMAPMVPTAGAVADAAAGAQAPDVNVTDLALRSGIDPLRASQVGENLARALKYAKGKNEFAFDPAKDVTPIPGANGLLFSRTSNGGGQIVQTPESIAAAETAKAGAASAVKYPKGTKVGVEGGVIVARSKDGDIIGIHGAVNPMNAMFAGPAAGGAAPAPVATGAAPAAAEPQTQADFDALPSGALYKNLADGKLYRKK